MKSYKIVADTRNMSREEWLKLRSRSVGGSEVAGVLGCSRWKTPLQVWGEKTGQLRVSVEQTEPMLWGTLIEPVIRAEFARRNKKEVYEAKYVFAHSKYDFMTCNIDGYVVEEDGSFSLLEIKTANAFSADDWVAGCPAEYYLQVQFYLAILGLQRAYLAVLVGGADYRQMEINRDDDVIAVIIAKVKEFWKLVQSKTAPPVVDSDHEILNKLYPISQNETLQLKSNVLLEKYELSKSELENAKKRKDEIEAQIKALMGEAEIAVCDGFRVSWKSSTRATFDVVKAKAFLTAEQIVECTAESQVRAFRVTKLKNTNKNN